MKTRRVFFYLIVASILISCEKADFRRDISGKWEFLSAGGGETFHSISVNFTSIVLDNSYNYFIYSNDTLKASGNYSLHDSGYNSESGLEKYYIRFNKGAYFNPTLIFPIDIDLDIDIQKSDTLVLYERGYADGIGFSFTKK